MEGQKVDLVDKENLEIEDAGVEGGSEDVDAGDIVGGSEGSGESGKKAAETIEKIKKFLLDNKDILILSGQLVLVTLVCVVGIKNDLTPDSCCKKKKKKKRK